MSANETAKVVLSVDNIVTQFNTAEGTVHAVNGVSFDVRAGELLGVVGESGCGKSVSAMSLMRLIPDPPGKIVDGEILFEGQDVLQLSMDEMRHIRGAKMSMVFQEPMTSLNPVLNLEKQLGETLQLHKGMTKQEAHQESVELLARVGIPDPERRVRQYPHQFSGGMRQRVMIAMALSCNPRVIIADEPTTALDVTVQKKVLSIMKDVISRKKMSMLLISHNLGVVREFADRIYVIYQGTILEEGSTEKIFNSPGHIYTQTLLQAIPKINSSKLPSLDSENLDYLSQPKFTH